MVVVGSVALVAIGVVLLRDRSGSPSIDAAAPQASLPESRSESTERAAQVASGEPRALSPEARANAVQRESSGRKRSARSAGAGHLGRVVDARTDEPVPDLRVEVATVDGSRESVTTDADGGFRTRAAIARPVGLTVHEPPIAGAPPEQGSLPFEALVDEPEPGVPVVVRIHVGPTYRLRPTRPLPERVCGVGHVAVQLDRNGGEHSSSALARALDDGTWRVRFVRPVRGDGEGRLTVMFTSWSWLQDDGRPSGADVAEYRGSTTVRSLVGRHPGVLAIDVEERLGLALSVVAADSEPIAEARVVVLGLDDPPLPDPVLQLEDQDLHTWRGSTEADGTALAFPLAAGAYRVVAIADSHAAAEQPFELLAGAQAAPPLMLHPLPVGGTIAGRVETDGWLPEHAREGRLLIARVQGLGAARIERTAIAGGNDVDGPFWEFAFEDLPGGEYRVDVFGVPEATFEPASARVTAPATDLRFRLDPTSIGVPIAFEPYDASTGAPIEDFAVALVFGGHVIPDALDGDHGEPLWYLPPDGRLRWWLLASGYRPAAGDERAFDRGAAPRVAAVALERGYGALIECVDAARLVDHAFQGDAAELVAAWTSPPIPGVAVHADGRRVATSDAHGMAALSLPAEPARIELHAPGWRVITSEGLEGGRVTDELAFIGLIRR